MDIRTKLLNAKHLFLLNETYIKDVKVCDTTIQKTADLREKFVQKYNEQANEINAVFALIERLPKSNREIIMQLYFENKSVESIAKTRNCTEDDVLKIHDVALQQLEGLMK